MSSIKENPHFQHTNRAPYELGLLLQQLPADFCSFKPVTHESVLIAEAAAHHAENANATVIGGIEGKRPANSP